MKPIRLVAALALIFCLGLASFRSPTAFWAGLAWTISSASLLAAIVGVAFGRGATRRWCIGYAVVGWTYFALTFNHYPLENVEAFLPTTRAFDEIYLASHVEPANAAANTPAEAWDTLKNEMAKQGASTYFNFNQIHFRWAWHALLSILLGMAGGYLALVRARPLPGWARRRSIFTLMAVVSASSGIFAALHSPTSITLHLTFGVFAASLGWAGLEAAIRRGQRQAAWAAYMLFAWAYLLAAYGEFDVRLLTYGNAPASGYLPTSRLLGELFPRLNPAPPPSTAMREMWNSSYHKPMKLALPYSHGLSLYYFVQTGHAIFGMMAGVAGGLVGFFARGRPY